jgi:ABC-type uncharacterized transport system substrate-binding protein
LGRTLIYALLLCLLVPAPLTCRAENLKVIVVLSENSAPYQSFANELNKGLPALIQSTVLEHPEQLSPDFPQADLIVAVGKKATEFATAKTSTPVLAVMIPQLGYEELLAQSSLKNTTRMLSAIYLDQPWIRRINFWRAAFPDLHRIGLLHTPDAHIDVARLRQDVAQQGGSLVAQPVLSADELFPKLEKILTSSDILLAIPDSLIYSSSSIRNILLDSYRHSVPLIGFSQAFVNAGALCAIFSTPEQLAEQAGATVISFARTRQLPEPQYSAAFTIAVNQQVARSLGIVVPSSEAIRKQMDKVQGSGH